MAKQPTIRVLLCLAFHHHWFIKKLDISNAFLYGTLEDEVDMDQPQGFIDPQYPSHGFLLSHSDSSLFVKTTSTSITIILVYVDDIWLTRSDSTLINAFLVHMHEVFSMKELGVVSYFLCISVQSHSHGFFLSQQKLVGGLQYLTITRPDITLVVNQACQHMHSPSVGHFTVVKRILRYVKGTLPHGLSFTPGPFLLYAYTDSNWGGDSVDRRSTLGFCVFLGPNLISWSAKKQATVSRSSIEAEYRSMAHTAAELCWLQQVLKELSISYSSLSVLWCDNVYAMALASNPVFHACSKYIEIDCHFIRERVASK
ncbi:uncharacterized protein LOC114285870 [Camellia sinensis]|uniref:uncharacterized protein LOC114285870 n=1 Tax=Camellia sinensis TaxID=4442 RepID=UPI0010369E92|nr:uncharacterized protein LOC114285870 [Camellia sinensis]